MNAENKKIKELEELADQILELKRKSRPRRPIVIEFCGTPKSGKTTTISSLNIFLKRNGFKTKVLSERASVCPITNKFDFLFNVWTSNSAIAELAEYLSYHPKNLDVILADRAIFDALCWFEWQLEHEHLDEDNYNALTTYLTMKKWATAIDLIFILKTEPSKSLEREYANLLTRKFGSVMNKRVLNEFNNSITAARTKYEKYFQKIELVETTSTLQNELSYTVTKRTLEILKRVIIESIGYVDFNDISHLSQKRFFEFSELQNLSLSINFGERDEVESDNKKVQPVPIMVFTNKKHDQFLILKKKSTSLSTKSPEKDKLLIYAGGHIRKEDKVGNQDFLKITKNAINREINEELSESFWPKEKNPSCIWLTEHTISQRHLAICFIMEIDFQKLNVDLNEYEFVQTKGTSKSGRILKIEAIKKLDTPLDSWSKIIFEKIFNIYLDEKMYLFDI